MTGARNAKGPQAKTGASADEAGSVSSSQIEYLLYQSTQGVHFMFDNHDIVKVMRTPLQKEEFHTSENMEKVQALLTDFLNCPTFIEKRSFLDRLTESDFELLIRAYFQLVENTILAHSDLRH